MKGDFTRFSFDPDKHYTGVRMQQGRVQLDADWNEQIDTQTRQQQLLTADLVGLTGAPQTEGGFQVTISADGKSLLLSKGRMYVGGLLCELNASTRYDQQPDYPGAAVPPGNAKDASGNLVYLAYLDAWPRHVTAIEDPSLAEIALGGPDTGTRVQTMAQVKLAALSSDGAAGPPPTQVTSADWSPLVAPSQAALAAAAFVPDAVGSLSLSPGYVALPAFLQPPPAGSAAPAVPPVDFSAGFAVEAWVYLPGPVLTTSAPILSLNDSGRTVPNTIALTSGPTDGAALQLTIGSASCTAAGALDPDRWTHVAVSIAPSAPTATGTLAPQVTMYKNGSPLTVTVSGTGTVAVPPNADRTSCFLGSTGAAPSFSGSLAEVRVWAAPLVAPVVSSRITGNEAHLVAYYKLNETGAATQSVTDSSAARRNATATGTFAWSAGGPALAAAGTSTTQYTGAENQLYRVEIHAVSPGGAVTFKWSRDNGSIASRATLGAPSGGAAPTQTLALATPIRDDVLGWAVGQWVEITTVTLDKQGIPGTPAQIQAVAGNTLTIAAVAGPGPGTVTVRRWDSNLSASTPSTFTPPAATPPSWQSPWFPLENGLAVQFGGRAPYRPGDYWLLPARTATQAIAWPLLPSGQPATRPPLGVEHRYAQLAKVYLTPAGTWKASPLPELRQVFPPMENALFSTGVLTYSASTVLVSGTLDVGTSAAPQTANVFGPLNAEGGLNVTGGAASIGAQGAGQTLNVFGPLNAEDGLNVTGAPLNVGTTAAGQPLNAFGGLRMNLGTLWLREGTDVSHGLVYGGGTAGAPFAPAPATNVDGPVLFGWGGGGLGSTNGGNKYALTWDSSQNVTVNGGLSASKGLSVVGGITALGTSAIISGQSLVLAAGILAATADITGNLKAGSLTSGAPKAFRIPHPTHPERDLVHACVEGPEAGVYYRGEAQLEGGVATVELPPYFEALTRADGRTVQLTPLWDGDDAPCSALCATPVREGRFRVRGVDRANLRQRFYWEVKAVRGDVEPLEIEPGAER